MKTEIFKIQIPIATNAHVVQAFIYNEDRSYQGFVPVEMVEGLFPEGVYKTYVRGFINKKGQLETGTEEVVGDQDW